VRAGRTFTTTGPLVELLVEGCAPGNELRLPEGGGTVEVGAWAESVLPFDDLQIVVNGEVVAREAAQAGPIGARANLRERISVRQSCWIAARCSSARMIWMNFMPTHVGAHTSPVYVRCGKEEQFDLPSATFLLGLVDGGLTWLDSLATPASEERHARARGVFESARARLVGRMRAH
jgi:hypothetical protein